MVYSRFLYPFKLLFVYFPGLKITAQKDFFIVGILVKFYFSVISAVAAGGAVIFLACREDNNTERQSASAINFLIIRFLL